MDRIRVGVLVLVGLVAMHGPAFADDDPPEERTRTFPDLKCRYTLPSSDWDWVESPTPGLRFMARNSDGIGVNLTATRLPGIKIDPDFVKGFESNYFTGELHKRGGEFITFPGLPCYEARGRMDDGSITVARVFTAHDNIYVLTIGGSDQPIENEPVFQEALRGFEFTAPPEVQRTGYAPGSSEERAYLLGRVTGMVCALVAFGSMGVLVLWLIVRASRKGGGAAGKASPKPSQPESIFFEDDAGDK